MYKKDVSVVIADDHPMLLKGLMDELSLNDYNVVGVAKNGMEALEQILTLTPVLALLDIDMPLMTGFEVVKMAREKGSNTKFIILSFHKETEYISQAKALQIDGYLLKEDSFSEIEKCMSTVLKNESYFSSSFETKVLKNASDEIKKLRLLTPSEITILKLVSQQSSNNEIAKNLSVSIRTIEKHRSNIIAKLNLMNGVNSLSSWAVTNKNIIIDL
jgi:two-component system nitrate/nitrite response regulator NarL